MKGRVINNKMQGEKYHSFKIGAKVLIEGESCLGRNQLYTCRRVRFGLKSCYTQEILKNDIELTPNS